MLFEFSFSVEVDDNMMMMIYDNMIYDIYHMIYDNDDDIN